MGTARTDAGIESSDGYGRAVAIFWGRVMSKLSQQGQPSGPTLSLEVLVIQEPSKSFVEFIHTIDEEVDRVSDIVDAAEPAVRS